MFEVKIQNIDGIECGFDIPFFVITLKFRGIRVRLLESDTVYHSFQMETNASDILHQISGALSSGSPDRFLIEMTGPIRHGKFVTRGQQLLAWASYNRAIVPKNLMHLNLPVRELRKRWTNKIKAQIYGAQSGKRAVIPKNLRRRERLSSARVLSLFNNERVILEGVSNCSYHAVAFQNGEICEKRGVKWHPEYKETVEWIRFDKDHSDERVR